MRLVRRQVGINMKDIMTIVEVAEALRLAEVTVQRKLTQGLLKGSLQTGGLRGRGKWFITREQVNNYLERYK